MPLGSDYDKLIESRFADIKNTGGRHGGSITAAAFLQKFVNDVPWAHLDIAGTGMRKLPQKTTPHSDGWRAVVPDRICAIEERLSPLPNGLLGSHFATAAPSGQEGARFTSPASLRSARSAEGRTLTPQAGRGESAPFAQKIHKLSG